MRAHNSTIRLKKKPCKKCGIPSYIFSKGRCKECAQRDGVAKNDAKEQEIEFAGLIEDLDTLFSQYIRKKYSKDGLVKCYTCPTILPVEMMTNGHYISRKHLYLRWDERNCRPQCRICNCHEDGNIPAFKAYLELENKGITEILLEESRMVYKWSKNELQAMIADYSNKLKRLNK